MKAIGNKLVIFQKYLNKVEETVKVQSEGVCLIHPA